MKWKLALGASAIAIALVFVVSLLQSHYLKEDIGDAIAARQDASTRQVALDLDAKLTSSLAALERSATLLPRTALDDPTAFRAYYAARPEMFLFFEDLILFRTDGLMKADLPMVPERVGFNTAYRAFFQQVLATRKSVISEPLAGRIGNQPTVFMAVPVLAADGRVDAVLIGTIRLLRTNFLGNLAEAKVGKTGYFFVLTRGANPVYVIHPDKARILKPRPLEGTPSTTRAIAGFEGTLEDTNSSGTRALFSYRQLKTTGWLLSSVLPVDEAYAPIVNAERRIAIVALLTALIVTPLVWFCTWRLFAPLTALLASINGSRQPTPRRADLVHGADEFGMLRHAFDELMAERDGAEVRLRENERLIRSVTDNLPALVCYIDRERRFRFNNRTYEKWLHRPLSSITGRSVAEVYGAEVYARLEPDLERGLRGETTRFEVEFAGRDGRTHVARGSYRPDVDDAGAVRGVYGLITDVTNLKEAERQLLEERARLASIIEGTNAGTWEWNVETGAAQVNARWAELLGYTLDELSPTTIETWTSRVHPADRPLVRERLLQHFDGTHRSPRVRGAACATRDGSWRWTLGYGRVSKRTDDGRPLLMHGVHLDVTARKRAEDALRVSKQFLERIEALSGVGGWELDLATQEVVWSDETCRLHDLEPGHSPTVAEAIAFIEPEGRTLIEAALERAARDGTPWDLVLPLLSAAGRPFWARAVGKVESEGGQPVRFVGAFQDVTARRAIEQELAESRQLLQTTLDSIADAVITTDVDGIVRWLNPIAERMTGWPKAEAVGRPIAQIFVIVDEATRMAAADPVAACIIHGRIVDDAVDTLLLSRNGAEFAIEDTASPIRGGDDRLLGVVLVFHDVSEQRRMTREMTHRATHDPLTGLVNRAEFEARLQRLALSLRDDGAGNALLYIDLDHFKLVNDACGHALGDQLLLQVSAMMRGCVRSRDTVARLGGDEFGVLLEHCDVPQAQKIAQKLCDEMEDFRFTHDGRRFRVGTSIGLVPFDRRWESVAAAVQAADASCYAAKAAGRNRVHVWVDADAEGHRAARRPAVGQSSRASARREPFRTLRPAHRADRSGVDRPALRGAAAPARRRRLDRAARHVPAGCRALPHGHPHRPLGDPRGLRASRRPFELRERGRDDRDQPVRSLDRRPCLPSRRREAGEGRLVRRAQAVLRDHRDGRRHQFHRREAVHRRGPSHGREDRPRRLRCGGLVVRLSQVATGRLPEDRRLVHHRTARRRARRRRGALLPRGGPRGRGPDHRRVRRTRGRARRAARDRYRHGAGLPDPSTRAAERDDGRAGLSGAGRSTVALGSRIACLRRHALASRSCGDALFQPTDRAAWSNAADGHRRINRA